MYKHVIDFNHYFVLYWGSVDLKFHDQIVVMIHVVNVMNYTIVSKLKYDNKIARLTN